MPKPSSAKKSLSRQEQQNLDIEIGFIEGVIRRDPQYVEALQILGDDYTRRGKFSEGLQVDERLAQLRPDDDLVQYNLACSYAVLGMAEPGIDALQRALELGYRHIEHLRRDPDLKSLRHDPRFLRLLRRF